MTIEKKPYELLVIGGSAGSLMVVMNAASLIAEIPMSDYMRRFLGLAKVRLFVETFGEDECTPRAHSSLQPRHDSN